MVGYWMTEIVVPWKESLDVVLLGLWSILSTAPKEKIHVHSNGGHTIPSSSYLWQMLFPMSVESCKNLSYDNPCPIWTFIY